MFFRQIGSALLIIAGGVVLLTGSLARYADRNLLDPQGFAERAVGILDDEGVQAEISDIVVNELEKLGAEREETRRAVDASIESITGDERFRDALTAALVTANEQALRAEEDGVSVRVEGAGEVVRDVVASQDPELTSLIPTDLVLPIANTDSTRTLVDIAREAEDLSDFSLVLPVLGGLLMLGGVLIANDRRTALFGASMGVALAGVAVFAGYLVGREIAGRTPDDEAAQDAARAIWEAVFGDLATIGIVMAVGGALVALVAAVVLQRRSRAAY